MFGGVVKEIENTPGTWVMSDEDQTQLGQLLRIYESDDKPEKAISKQMKTRLMTYE